MNATAVAVGIGVTDVALAVSLVVSWERFLNFLGRMIGATLDLFEKKPATPEHGRGEDGRLKVGDICPQCKKEALQIMHSPALPCGLGDGDIYSAALTDTSLECPHCRARY